MEWNATDFLDSNQYNKFPCIYKIKKLKYRNTHHYSYVLEPWLLPLPSLNTSEVKQPRVKSILQCPSNMQEYMFTRSISEKSKLTFHCPFESLIE